MAKPPPHANNLTAAMANVAQAHDAISARLATHAQEHADRLAELRKRIEQNAEIERGIARHTAIQHAAS